MCLSFKRTNKKTLSPVWKGIVWPFPGNGGAQEVKLGCQWNSNLSVCGEHQHYETVSWKSKCFVKALLNTVKVAVKGDPNKLFRLLGSCARRTKSYFRAQITLQNTGKHEQAREAAEIECFLSLCPSPFNKLDCLSKIIPIPMQKESQTLIRSMVSP